MRNGGNTQKNGNGGNLGFEAEMFKAAGKLRCNMEPSHYTHVALGLIFLKYILDAFETKRTARLAEDEAGDEGCERVTPQASCALRPPPCEDKDECLADNVFWVPKAALLPKLLSGGCRFSPVRLLMLDILLRRGYFPSELPPLFNRDFPLAPHQGE